MINNGNIRPLTADVVIVAMAAEPDETPAATPAVTTAPTGLATGTSVPAGTPARQPTPAPTEVLSKRQTAIAVGDVSVRLGGNPVLKSVSFEARPRDIAGLIGSNGAGKCALLRTPDAPGFG